jgi:hypothetical protein
VWNQEAIAEIGSQKLVIFGEIRQTPEVNDIWKAI